MYGFPFYRFGATLGSDYPMLATKTDLTRIGIHPVIRRRQSCIFDDMPASRFATTEVFV
jgi:hypothetical protein